MAVALLFIDGVGVGRRDPQINPLARAEYLLSRYVDAEGPELPSGGSFIPVDATFGVKGRPQSASNQTAMLTAQPAPQLIGRHVLGYPDAPLRALLAEHSIVKQLIAGGRTASFANAYPAGYLDALGLHRRPASQPDVVIPPRAIRRIKPSATTLAMAAGKIALRTLDDARRGEGLTHDVTGRRGRSHGFDLPQRTPEEAAAIFVSLLGESDFLLFEHYLADEAGHAQDEAAATDALETFDAFARAVISQRGKHHILICSDHGNVEDLSTRSHTLNAVPVLYFGEAQWVPSSLSTVADVGGAVMKLLDVTSGGEG